jgi:nicotinate-nucleotide adenylyltransferase
VTGLFFGSFNPIHVGHLIIANYMVEFTDLSEVWFVISPHNPFKKKESLLNNIHRLQLVRIAIEDNKKLKASNIEFSMSQPSYTADTLAYLRDKYPKKKFALIMGSDNLETFHRWKNYENILINHKIYVYPRPDSNGGELRNHNNIKMVNAPMIEISASFIRNAIREKKDVRYMLTESVYQYIREMHFYKKVASETKSN